MFAWPQHIPSEPAPIEARSLRQALAGFCTGVCLVTTVSKEGKREGMTINSFSSVSLDPPLVLWGVREAARSASVYVDSPAFIISVLAADQQDLALHFARPSEDKFSGVEDLFDEGLGACPRLKRAVSTYECQLYSCHHEGDHFLLVGQVKRFSHAQLSPLLFHRGRMGSLADHALQAEQVATAA